MESQHQLPECRSPERQAGTAGHHLAVGLLPGMRSNRSVEMCLSRTGTLNCGAAAFVDKEKESSGTTGATRHSKAPGACTAFFHLSPPKTGLDFSMLIGFLHPGLFTPATRKPNGTGAKTSTTTSLSSLLLGSRTIKTRLLKLASHQHLGNVRQGP